jgi:hypothetical protein
MVRVVDHRVLFHIAGWRVETLGLAVSRLLTTYLKVVQAITFFITVSEVKFFQKFISLKT